MLTAQPEDLAPIGGSRLHEMNIEAFLDQAREYDTAGDVRDGLLKVLNLLGTTHPFAVSRVAELDKWRRGGEYDTILGGDYRSNAPHPSLHC